MLLKPTVTAMRKQNYEGDSRQLCRRDETAATKEANRGREQEQLHFSFAVDVKQLNLSFAIEQLNFIFIFEKL